MRASVKQDHASRELTNTPRVGLTARQRDALAFIKRYLLINGRAPALQDITDAIGLRAKSGAYRLVNGLVERGHIRRNPDVPAWEGRAIELLDPLPTIGPSLNGEPLRFVSFHAGRDTSE